VVQNGFHRCHPQSQWRPIETRVHTPRAWSPARPRAGLPGTEDTPDSALKAAYPCVRQPSSAREPIPAKRLHKRQCGARWAQPRGGIFPGTEPTEQYVTPSQPPEARILRCLVRGPRGEGKAQCASRSRASPPTPPRDTPLRTLVLQRVPNRTGGASTTQAISSPPAHNGAEWPTSTHPQRSPLDVRRYPRLIPTAPRPSTGPGPPRQSPGLRRLGDRILPRPPPRSPWRGFCAASEGL